MKLPRHETPKSRAIHGQSLQALPRGGDASSLPDGRSVRQAKKETAQRVEDLRLQLLRITEKHMDQAVRILRDWLD
ncbi:MAG: flagellar M-ring protein FliF [Desulfovibrio sp.]|jgi:hypothetical protein|nr:flagellar M-ring protein FliF [Desulfovibrio sp.]